MKDPTQRLLYRLRASIVREEAGVLTIQVLPDMPSATVEVKASELRYWCLMRLSTRAAHKNRGIGVQRPKKYK
jgi:hypothetical protein